FGSTYDLKFVGDIAYLATWWGLTVVDFSDPAIPREIGRQETPHYTLAVAAASNTVLVGSYGYGMSVFDLPLAGDLDSNGRVDLADLTRFLSLFGAFVGGGPAHGDFNCDGWVDLDDLAVVLAAFGAAR